MLFVSIIHTHKDGGVLDILIRIPFSSIQYSIRKISNKIPWIVSHSNVSRYFLTLLIWNYKFEIATVPQISLQDNLIIFNYSYNRNYYLPQTTPSLPQVACNKPDYINQLKFGLPYAIWSEHLGNYDLMLPIETNISDKTY